MRNIQKYWNDDHGEAILEFVYGIAINKLRLLELHEKEFLKSVRDTIQLPVVRLFLDYIENGRD